jgi:hypothetical protein
MLCLEQGTAITSPAGSVASKLGQQSSSPSQVATAAALAMAAAAAAAAAAEDARAAPRPTAAQQLLKL